MRFVWLSLIAAAPLVANSASGYVGSAVCAQCHRGIAASQSKTNMALTWQGTASRLLPADFHETKSEGAVQYRFRTGGSGITYEVKMPDGAALAAPVEEMVGGKRHGISFLARVTEISGLPLQRPVLVETRYLHSTHENGLALSPGFPADRPTSYDTALGRALTPEFEKKCLACHGEPAAHSKLAGVNCESCHGPGQAHLEAVAQGKPRAGIGKAENCAQCHSGFSEISDPLPDDLLISNQVNALHNSECYIESNAALSCTTCHDPHQDSPDVDVKSVAACRSCHSAAAQKRAALCPVNQKDGCLGCHMPGVTKGSFTMLDHWIRVHPEQGLTGRARDASLRTTVRPRRVFLRIMVIENAARAKAVYARLLKGEPFFDLARDNSVDASAAGGGYIGEMWLDRMDAKLADAAAKLAPGETSPPIEANGKFVIVSRMPRDFRYEADRLEQAASELKSKGRLDDAIAKFQQALQVYPYFLRALVHLGATLGEQGNAARAAGVLEFAAQLYPKDPSAQYNLGIAYGALGRAADEVQAYRKAIDLEPSLLAAYQNLGAALFTAGGLESAAEVYRRGLEQDPLSAPLYYNLGIVVEKQGDAAAAKRATDLAAKLDPEFVKRQQQGQP